MRAEPVSEEIAEFDRKVGARIRRRRLELRISQKAFGAALGVSFQQVQKYESGATRLLASRLFVISQVLGTSVPMLLGLQEAEPPAVPRSEITRLTEAWSRIPPGRSRRQLLRFIETLCLDVTESGAAKGEPWNASKR